MNPNIVNVIISIHHIKGFLLQITVRKVNCILHHIISPSIGAGGAQ